MRLIKFEVAKGLSEPNYGSVMRHKDLCADGGRCKRRCGVISEVILTGLPESESRMPTAH
jgi:hypothetical protein